MTESNVLLMQAVQKWEAVSVQLETVLTAHLEACTLVNSYAVRRLNHASDIISGLERAAELLGHRLMQQLTGSRAHLARARNKLATSIYQLPDEILVKIFLNFIRDSDSSELRSIERGVRVIYSRLYTLMSVCADWRKIGLSHGTFWSLIPVLNSSPGNFNYGVPNLSIERAGSSHLYLAGAIGEHTDSYLLAILAQHGYRLDAMNIHGGTPGPLREIATNAMMYCMPGQLTSLSAGYQPSDNQWNSAFNPSVLSYGEDLFSPNCYDHSKMQLFAESFHTLRLGGFKFRWDGLQFPNLVELKLQEVILDDISTVKNLFLAVAASSTLRNMHLISITIDTQSHIFETDWKPGFVVTIPCLESLYLQDLERGLLQLILHSISPGPYTVAIGYLVPECVYAYTLTEGSIIQSLDPVDLPSLDIRTLMLAGANARLLPFFLKSMPSLKNIYIRTYLPPGELREMLEVLVRPIGVEPINDLADSVKLDVLYINNPLMRLSKKSDQDLLKEVITSHGIKELGLGGIVPTRRGPSPPYPRFSLDDPSADEYLAPLKLWLMNNVPKLIPIKTPEDFPEFAFRMGSWEL